MDESLNRHLFDTTTFDPDPPASPVLETWEEIRDLVENRYRWRPDTRLHLVQVSPWESALEVAMRVRDAYAPEDSRLLKVTHRRPLRISPPVPLMYAIRAIRQELHNVDMHESDEWIRVDGEMLFNPHRADR